MTWERGDLALCLHDDWQHDPHFPNLIFPRRGGIYSVVRLGRHPISGKEGFTLEGLRPSHFWLACLFKKIPPLTDEERNEFLIDLGFDLEVINLEKAYKG